MAAKESCHQVPAGPLCFGPMTNLLSCTSAWQETLHTEASSLVALCLPPRTQRKHLLPASDVTPLLSN